MSVLRTAVLVVLLAGAFAHADNWPQWRGADHDGVSKETGLPAEWSATKNIVWKLPLPGMGGSTPDRLGRPHLPDQRGRRRPGAAVRQHRRQGAVEEASSAAGGRAVRGDEGNGASASPSTDGKHVCAFVGTGELALLRLRRQGGLEVQRPGALRQVPTSQFGMHSTPVLHGDRLYLQLIHSGGALGRSPSTRPPARKSGRSSARATAGPRASTPTPRRRLWQKGDDAYLVVARQRLHHGPPPRRTARRSGGSAG